MLEVQDHFVLPYADLEKLNAAQERDVLVL